MRTPVAKLPARLGVRYSCLLRDQTGQPSQHDYGPGRPQRRKCRYCGGKFFVERGYWGTFCHRGDGDYPLERAVSLHTVQLKADRKAAEDSRELVVRWVFVEDITD